MKSTLTLAWLLGAYRVSLEGSIQRDLKGSFQRTGWGMGCEGVPGLALHIQHMGVSENRGP